LAARALQLANRHASPGSALRKRLPQGRFVNAEKRAAVARREAAFFEEVEDSLFEAQQAYGVGDCGALFARAGCNFFLGHVELIQQAVIRPGFLHRVQVFALKVLHKCDLKRLLLRNIAQNSGNTLEAGALRCSPAALARDELEAAAIPAQHQRLDYSAGLDGSRQLF
jgi:hypothetical protein